MARVNVTLDDDYAARLAAMAERMHVNEGTLARSLLSTAIDDVDPGATDIVQLLDGIDGAWEAVERGLAQAERGETIPLDQLPAALRDSG